MRRSFLGGISPRSIARRRVLNRRPASESLESRDLMAVVLGSISPMDGSEARSASQGYVASAVVVPLSGRIEASSDLGPSSVDGITSESRPILSGTARPFSILQLYAVREGASAPVAVGQAIVDATGGWRTQVGPLADGVYQLAATETAPGSLPGARTTLQRVIIDTDAPRVVQVAYVPRLREVTVVYRDNLSGLDRASTLERKNYTFIGVPLRRIWADQPAQSVAQGTIAQDPEAVNVALPPRAVMAWPRVLRILSGGVRDMAGNPLAGNADALGGGNFQVALNAHRRVHPLPGTAPTVHTTRR